MTHAELAGRLAQVESALAGMPWASVVIEIEAEIDNLTQQLIAQNNDETRGRIKALRALLELPETLQHERDGLTAALSEQSDAAH